MSAMERLPQQRGYNGDSDEQCDQGNPNQESANREGKNESRREETDAERQQDGAKRSKPCDIDAVRAAPVA